jgi:hypothetical protein
MSAQSQAHTNIRAPKAPRLKRGATAVIAQYIQDLAQPRDAAPRPQPV